MSDHATVQRDGYQVPLIGVPKDAVTEMCWKCGKPTPIGEISLEPDGNMVCPKCRSKP